jgi:murein DD-endopeptidase MepM/ murein hydrolase activator NlpD
MTRAVGNIYIVRGGEKDAKALKPVPEIEPVTITVNVTQNHGAPGSTPSSGSSAGFQGFTPRSSGQLRVDDVLYYALFRGGFTGSDLVVATAIAKKESGYDSNATRIRSDERSYGLWQINTLAWAADPNRLKAEPGYCAEIARSIFNKRNGNFRDWIGYKSGAAYTNELNKVKAAIPDIAKAAANHGVFSGTEVKFNDGRNNVTVTVPAHVPSGSSSLAPLGQGQIVFPVVGKVSYGNDWGNPRGVGRTHKGTDIMAAKGTPLVACKGGVISKRDTVDSWNGEANTGDLGGITIGLTGDDGIYYYYAHMNGITGGIYIGSRVEPGQSVGTVGNTGNARYTSPHLHFGMKRQGTWINPYPYLRDAVVLDRVGGNWPGDVL